MTSSDRFRNALVGLDLPAEWKVDVAIRPRRRCAALEVKPGGDVVVLVPPTTDPDERWGTYTGPPQHTTTLHWAVFGLPVHLAEYMLVHEQAHATRPAGQPHGRAWQRQVTLWMPDWRERKAELAEVGRHAWLGDTGTAAARTER